MQDASGARLWPALRLVLGVTVAGLLALQVWRPFFFLTDDNATFYCPIQVEVLRNLVEGKPVLVSNALFGGNYHWGNDISVYPILSPFAFLAAWTVWTPWPHVIIEIVSSCTLLAVAASFCACAHWLRRTENLPLTDRALVLATLSYTFAPYHLLMSASWIGYLNAQAAWPLLFVAVRHPSFRQAAGIATAALGFSVFGGNFHALSFLLLGAGLWGSVEAVRQKSARPLLALLCGGLVCFALMWLCMGDPLAGLKSAEGVRSLAANRGVQLNLTPPQLGASLLLGPLSQSVVAPMVLFGAGAWWSAGVGCTLVGLPLLVVLCTRRWRTGNEWILAASALLLVLVIWRPGPLHDLFSHLPLLRSLRWPFREISALIAVLHLWFVLVWRPPAQPWLNRAVWAAAALPVLACLAGGPPAFAAHDLSRRLVFSPTTAAYWNELRPLLGNRPIVAGRVPNLAPDLERFPLPLLAAPNFSALYELTYAGGNSTTSPAIIDPVIGLIAAGGRGLASGPRLAAYLERRPQTNLFLLHRLDPAIWSLHIPGDPPRYFQLDDESLTVRQIRGLPAP